MSLSFQRLMKLSWQAAHLMFMPEKDLRGVLCGLHRRSLAGAHDAAPGDAGQEALGSVFAGGFSSARTIVVVRHVVLERAEQPAR